MRPYEEEFLNKMEIFNEVVNIFITDLLFSFTGVINQQTEEKTMAIRDKVGIVFIGMLLATVAVHISFLIGGQVKTMKQSCTKKALKSKWNDQKKKAFALTELSLVGPLFKLCCKKKSYEVDEEENTSETEKHTA